VLTKALKTRRWRMGGVLPRSSCRWRERPQWREAIAEPKKASPGVIHRHAGASSIDGGFGVRVAALTFAYDRRVSDTPSTVGQHNDEVFAELGAADGVNVESA
jgi:hypothetical protein